MSSSEYINNISREYSLYTLYNRAIPSVTDGLKPSQRIGLWLLKDTTKPVTSMAVAGSYLNSKLYCHGDASASEALGLMAAPYLNNVPFITGDGNFGSKVAPYSIGAARYTQIKRSKFAEDVIYQDMDILPMVDNYDGSTQMPSTFLPFIPIVLLNGVRGIATGWATTILPRKLSDIIDATEEALTTGKVTNPLLPYYSKYDVDVTPLGEGKYCITGKLEIKNTSTVVVTELPPDLPLVKFKERLIKLENDKEIIDFTDKSSDKIEIEIKMRRSVLMDLKEEDLIELFKLRTIVTENCVVIGWDGKSVIKYDNVQELVLDFVKWRFQWYIKRFERLIEEETRISLLWLSYISCYNGTDNLEPLQKMVSKLKGRKEVVAYVNSILEELDIPIDDDIVNQLVNMPLYRWSMEGYDEATNKLEQSMERVELYTELVNNDDKRKKVFVDEVRSIRKGKY